MLIALFFLVYCCSSGFYHDPNAGWYYSSKDGLYYKFENGNYVLLDSQKVLLVFLLLLNFSAYLYWIMLRFYILGLIDPGFGALSTSQVGEECAIDEGGEVLPGNTIHYARSTNSSGQNDEYYSSYQRHGGTAADECTSGE